MFITLEGIDGSGKTTLTGLLAEKLRQPPHNRDVVITREPGGTAIAESIRTVLLENDAATIPAVSQILLFWSARIAHNQQLIIPALEAGKCVICDRYIDSTYVYQGLQAHGADILGKVEACLKQDFVMPQTTLLIDVDVDLAWQRRSNRLNLNHFDKLGKDEMAHRKVAYLQRAAQSPHRIKVIDGNQPVDKVLLACLDAVL